MNKPMTMMALVAAAAATSACGSLSRAIGAGKQSPDEFRVVSQAPLTLPPDYSLRPPRPGDPRPQELAPDADARAALFGDQIGASAGAGERALVGAAGADAVDPNIRDTIDFEAQGVVRRNQDFVDRLLIFRSGADTSAPLDPADEARRLEDDEQIRRATGGGEVTIERNRGGFKLPGT
jgi:hypothetical protein